LLLESRCLLEDAVHRDVIEEVVAAYWEDYEDHKDDFIPAFLANDILRLWRTFCVNYEARTEREPEEKKAERKLTNYKLKHSRLLTCYSALLYLLARYACQNSVHPPDIMVMIGLSPTRRLEALRGDPALADSHQIIDDLLAQYERFLETTNASEDDLISRFRTRK
jgi:hypothetical protein